ncbi:MULTISPECIES: class I tRNA ligase family protein [unclassified Bradyrhizobium]
MVKDGLPEICVSHPTDIGIPIPIKGYEDQRIYVWFEMAAGYSSLSAAIEKVFKWRQREGSVR